MLGKLHRGQVSSYLKEIVHRCIGERRKRYEAKLMEIKRLRAKGHRITLLDERQSWRLADRC